MAEIVLGILGPAIEIGKCIVVPIKRQLNYLCCFNTNVQTLKEEAKKLEHERAGLKMDLDTAQENLGVPDPKVEIWLEEVKEIQQKMSELETEITNLQVGGYLCMKSRYSVSKRAYKTAEAMKQKSNDRRNIIVISHHRPSPASLALDVLERPISEFESRKKIEEEIMVTFRDENVKVMGICGMGGVGKSTLAEKVMNRVREENLFDELMMVVVSQNADKEKIQVTIAGNLGLKLEGADLSSRAKELCARLKDGNKILIVLDDVWEELKLRELGIPSKGGCSILLTSRDRGVLKKMDAKPILEMKTLIEEEALSFFKEKLGFCADDPNWISNYAPKIAKECKGLPLALESVAGALKGQKDDVYFWKDALQQLQSSNPEDLPEVLKDVYAPLKLSYDYLSSQNERPLFLLCCLFPEDDDIPLEDLAVYAMGVCMFGKMRNLEDVRNRTCSLLNRLKSCFLLLKGCNEEYVRMHDVVRDVAIFIASKEKQLIKCGDNSTWISAYLGEKIELFTGSTFPNLRLLLVDGSADMELAIDDIPFEGMNELSVLSIRFRYSLRPLPNTITFLMNLVTLILEYGSSEIMCVICELVNLEILICRHCVNLKELPSETTRLKCLKLLEISDCRAVKKIGPRVLSSLDKLEELKIVRSFNEWEADDGEKENENAGLSELESLSNLTHLEIQIKDYNLAAQQVSLSRKIEKYYIAVGDISHYPPEFGKIMQLHIPREITLGRWIHEYATNAEYLYLEGDGSKCLDLGVAKGIRCLRVDLCSTSSLIVRRCDAIVVFPLLENMHLHRLYNLEEIICDIDAPISEVSSSSSSSNYSFKNLKKLRLIHLPALKRLWKKSPSVVSHYNNLSSIRVRSCQTLLNLFPLSMAKDCFPQLKSLSVKDCDLMEQVFSWNEEEEEENEKNITISFPKLKRIRLSKLPNLTAFYQGVASIEFPLLTHMKIRSCPKLSGLVSNSDGICNRGDHHSLQLLCIQKVSFSTQIPIGSFTKLEQLKIDNFGNIKSLFSVSIAQNLGSLKKLRIRDCKHMVKVIEEEDVECSNVKVLHFRHLEKLYLESLPKLTRFCNSRLDLEFPKLLTVLVNGCPEMESLNLGCLTTPNLDNLEDLTISDCSRMEQVFSWSEEENGKEIIGQSRHVTFPNLKIVRLDSLPRLTNICKGVETLDLPLLTEMEMMRCQNLEGLVSSTTSGDINNKVVSKLEEQTIYCSLSIIHNFAALEKLKIGGYDKISCLFSVSIADNLTNLRELRIGSCKNLVKVIEKEVDEYLHESTLLFPHLEELYLEDLPKLKTFCEWRCGLKLPSLNEMRIDSCPEMEKFSLGSLTTPDLNVIETESGAIAIKGDLNGVLQKRFCRINEESTLSESPLKEKNKIDQRYLG